MDPFGVCL